MADIDDATIPEEEEISITLGNGEAALVLSDVEEGFVNVDVYVPYAPNKNVGPAAMMASAMMWLVTTNEGDVYYKQVFKSFMEYMNDKNNGKHNE